ncbi:hypothetical protein C6A85_03740, partial [Mycobacterium sp. ITM-2017-0098]
ESRAVELTDAETAAVDTDIADDEDIEDFDADLAVDEDIDADEDAVDAPPDAAPVRTPMSHVKLALIAGVVGV